ncbi:GRAM domain-containing protein [Sporobolomyces koalae]|uniref:GRAM domain-containing protein n=1 Tax=Sporobolomyces koalae TaxID=500713 RepID=UPI003171B5EA
MASINWVVLDANTLRPVPLPREKLLLSLSAVSLSLVPTRPGSVEPSDPGFKVERGSVYLTNQRVVYVSPPALTDPMTSGAPSPLARLDTLSVPYPDFEFIRLNQPLFGANNFQATCLAAPEGGLQGSHELKLYFKEGGGFDFYSTVLEMRQRIATAPPAASSASRSGSARGEDLPLYSRRAEPEQNRVFATRTSPPRDSVQSQAELPTPSASRTGVPPLPPPIGNDLPPSYTA